MVGYRKFYMVVVTVWFAADESVGYKDEEAYKEEIMILM